MFTKTNTCKRPESSNRIARECRIDTGRKPTKTIPRVAANSQSRIQSVCRRPDTTTKTCSKKTAAGIVSSESSSIKAKSSVCKGARPCPSNYSDRNPRTWFEVLLKSPEKCRPEKILRTNLNRDVDVPCRCTAKTFADDIEETKENFAPRSENARRFSLLFDILCDKINETSDKEFLNILNAVRTLFDNPTQSYSELRNPFSVNQLTDDDKNKFQKPAKQDVKSSNSSDLVLLRALLKETKVQKEMLQSLTVQMSQLREENKMLNQLKEARLTLESKLVSYSTEIGHLKKEREKAKRLLELRDKEIDDLRRLVSVLKVAGNNEMNERSIGLIATPPECSISFDLPIRPASSSPTEEIEPHKKKLIRRRKNSATKSIHFENHIHKDAPAAENAGARKDSDNEVMLREVKDDVNRFLEVIESDMANLDTNDISLNLSDVTYKWSV